MKFGIMLPHFRQTASRDNIIRVTREAEAMGFDSVWVSDHLAIPTSNQERLGRVLFETFTTLSFVAAITSRISIGSSVIVLPFRNPLFMARSLATTDVLSNGRVILGVGVGSLEVEYQALGVDFVNRGAIADEALQIIKHVWANPEPDFQGRWWTIKDVVIEPSPVQKPHPPIWVGGRSRRAMRRVVELGDVWHPTRPKPGEVRQGRQYIAQLCERYQRDPATIEVGIRHAVQFIDGPGRPEQPLIGTEEHIVRTLQSFRDEGSDHMVLDLFYGTPELHQETTDTMIKAMERFMQQVAPRID